ncbi:iron ABC transporter permease [Pseudomonas syringae]|uniref:Iron ABC transporter permease n=2 Tax=Pseudomonas syringae TaxID=317 RepID=A0A085VK33_PSESX|nr:iron ABC transporter permease [Pseudomonas syringae]
MKLNGLLMLLLLALVGCDQQTTPEQGFAGLGNQAEQFTPVTPGRAFAFPQDHAAHPGFRIEWWYITANLKDEKGQDFGVQWTLFRNALRAGDQGSGWNEGTIWMGHAAVTSATRHYAAERYARGGVEQAGVKLAPFSAWIDDWSMSSDTPTANPLASLQLQAKGAHFAYRLHLSSSKPLVLQGQQGFSKKSEQGQASYYYSQPYFEAKGEVTLDGKRYQVSGPAWLDREWSSQPLTANQTGWDWFSVHLEGGDELMLYRMRQKQGEPYLTGTWISANGNTEQLNAKDISLEPLADTEVAGHKMPTRWSVKIPGKGLDIITVALNPKAWMDLQIPYWEGPITLSGSHNGVGYLEMTGY